MRSRSTRIALLSLLVFFFGYADVRAAIDAGTLAEPMESGKGNTGAGIAGSGLGSFKTDLFTGSASYSVPIAVPPGTGGMQPALSLAYSSGAPNGWVGFGWSLGMGAISRSTKNGVPSYDDEADEFLLGGDRLIAEDPLANPVIYHTERESFQRIEYDRGNDAWTLTAPNGTRLFFGSSCVSKVAVSDPCVTPRPPTFSWLLDRIEDTHSNGLLASYASYEDNPGVLYLDEITYTHHGGGPTAPLVGDKARSVKFCLEGDSGCDPDAAGLAERPDILVNYMGGFRSEMRRRLKVIKVTIKDPSDEQLVRKYVLDYAPTDNKTAFRSLLAKVTQKGRLGGELPPIMFTYQQPAPGFGGKRDWHNPGGGAIRPNKPNQTPYALLDIDGDGVIDRVRRPSGSDFRIYRRRVDFQSVPGFDAGYETWADPAGLAGIRYSNDGGKIIRADLIDLNSDGLPDRVRSYDAPAWKVWFNDGSGFDAAPTDWANPSYDLNIDIPGSPSGSYETKSFEHITVVKNPGATFYVTAMMIDLNGDGLPDRLAKGPVAGAWLVYWNNGIDGFEESVSWSNPSGVDDLIKAESGPSTSADLFDINGDGLVDRVVGNGDEWTVCLGNGRTGFEDGISWANPSDKPQIRQVENSWTSRGDVYADVFDVNGDGLPDRVVYTTSSYWKVYLNDGTRFLSPYVKWPNPSGFPLVRDIDGDVTTADVLDLDGDGLPDRVACKEGDCSGNWWKRYPVEGGKPGLLSGIENGLGGRVDIEYTSSSFYKYTDGWVTYFTNPDIPFVVQTVSRVTRDDGRGLPNSVSETNYYYEGGRYDAASREFLGFAYVETVGDEVAGTAADGEALVRPVGAISFHQDEQLRGRVAWTAAYDLPGPVVATTRRVQPDDSPLVETKNFYVVPDAPGSTLFHDPYHGGVSYDSAGQGIQLAHLVRQDVVTYDSNLDTLREHRTEFIYDDYGNVIEERILGETALEGTEEDGYVKRTAYAYNTDPDFWIVNTPKEVSRERLDGSELLERSWVFYDGSETLGEEPQQGDITRRTFWLDSTGSDGSIPDPEDPTTRLTYDIYGNVKRITDPNGNWIETFYEATYQTFPERIVNRLGHEKQYTYDPDLGQILTETDANGNVSRLKYDEYGRQVRAYAKDGAGGEQFLFREIAYDLSGIPDYDTDPLGAQNITTLEYFGTEPGEAIASVAYFDGLGRTYHSETEGEDGKLIHTERFFDRLGRAERESFPYFASGGVPEKTVRYREFLYDALGRPREVRNPDGTFVKTHYRDWSVTTFLHPSDSPLDPFEQKRRTVSDAFGRIVMVEEFAGALNPATRAVTTYAYDPLGNLINVRDDVGRGWEENQPGEKRHVTTIDYDSLNRKVSIDDPDMGFWQYKYDKVGNLEEQTDAEDQVIGFRYDELNRVTEKLYDGTVAVSYEYDSAPANCPSSGETNLIGRLSAVKDQPGCESFAYDFLGRTVKTTRVTHPYQFERSYIYDLAGRVTEVTFPDDEHIGYDYAGGPYLQRIFSITNGKEFVQGIDYDARDQITRIDLGEAPDGSAVAGIERSYHPVTFRLDHIRAFPTADPSARHLDRSYTYYPTGDVEDIIDQLDPNRSRTFFYDDLSRLILAMGPYGEGGGAGFLSYQYDATGNLLSFEGKILEYDPAASLMPHAADRVVEDGVTTTLTYDLNGNLVQKGDLTVTWDIENRPTSLVRPTTSGSYVYDHAGSRVWKSSIEGGLARHDYYVGGDFEWNEMGQEGMKHIFVGGMRVATETFVGWEADRVSGVLAWIPERWKPSGETVEAFGLFLLAVLMLFGLVCFDRWRRAFGCGWAVVSLKRAGVVGLAVVFWVVASVPARAQCIGPPPPALHFYLTDHLGSTSLVLDQAGVVLEEVEYAPFGETLSWSTPVSERYRFNGKERDRESGFYYYGARYYDPGIGKFVSPDSIVPDPADPQTLNRYAYVRNNPLKYTDPTGNFFFIAAIVGAIVGAAGAAGGAVGALVGAGASALGTALSGAAGVGSSLLGAGADFLANTLGYAGSELNYSAKGAYSLGKDLASELVSPKKLFKIGSYEITTDEVLLAASAGITLPSAFAESQGRQPVGVRYAQAGELTPEQARRMIMNAQNPHPGVSPGFGTERDWVGRVFAEEYAMGYANATLWMASVTVAPGATPLAVTGAERAALRVAMAAMDPKAGFIKGFGAGMTSQIVFKGQLPIEELPSSRGFKWGYVAGRLVGGGYAAVRQYAPASF